MKLNNSHKFFLLLLTSVVHIQANKNRELEAKFDDFLSGKLDLIRNSSQVHSAFSVTRSRQLKGQRHLENVVKFDHVEYNIGKDYSKKSGTYQAPVHGVYVFKYLSGKLPKKTECKLMKNNFEVNFLKLDGDDVRTGMDNDVYVILELRKTDRVWIRLAHNPATRRHDGTRNSTIFSGRLIAESDSKVIADIRRNGSGVRLHSKDKRDVNNPRSDENQVRKELVEVIANGPMITLVNHDPMTDDFNQLGASTQSGNAPKIAFSVTSTKSIVGGKIMDTYVGPPRAELADSDNTLESAEGRIHFDKTFVNLAGAFSLTHNEFKAPIDGVYYFSYNVGKFPEKLLSVILMKNVNEVQVLIYNDSEDQYRGMQSQSLMLQLSADETVWLKAFDSGKYAVYSNLGNYITFTGYLVYQL